MKPEIAVLITCYNRREKTLACLKNLFEQKGLLTDFEITVFLTDDASTDGTAEAVKMSFPAVDVLPGNGHLFWNKGMHLAWSTAIKTKDYDYYLWLNDDTVLKKDAILTMLECENKFKNNSLVCGAVRAFDKARFTYGGRLKNGNGVIPNGTIQECFMINGNGVLVNKKIVAAIGILDPVFPHAIGDVEYGLRALRAGFKIITPSDYIGFCDSNEFLPKWCYNSTPIMERFKSLYSPLGNCHPYYYFIFEHRHFGIFEAVKHYFSIHLRAVFPSLWNSKIQKEAKLYE